MLLIARADVGVRATLLRRGHTVVFVLHPDVTGEEQCQLMRELVAEDQRLGAVRAKTRGGVVQVPLQVLRGAGLPSLPV